MKCNCVGPIKNQSFIKRLLPNKKRASLITSAILLPVASFSLLNANKNSIKKENSDVLYNRFLEETCNEKPRFNEEEKNIINRYYKRNPKLTLQILSAKNNDNTDTYRFCGFDTIKVLYSFTDEDYKSLHKVNPTVLQEILSNNTIPIKYIANILKLASKHPEEYLKMKNSGIFQLIQSKDLDENILEKINQNIYFSKESLTQINDKKNKKEIITKLPPETIFEESDNIINDGEVYQIKNELLMAYNNKKYYMKVKLSPYKFEDLFEHFGNPGIKQGKIGDCWLISTIDGMMNSSTGKAFIYKLFEQDGEDILITFPKAKQKIRFKNGELGSADSGLIAPKGIRMLEQAYAIYAQNKNSKDKSEIVVQDIKNLNDSLSILDGGHSSKAIESFLGKYSEIGSLKDTLKSLYSHIRYKYTHKKTKGEISRYIEKIKKYANDRDKIVNIDFHDYKSKKREEKLILPEYHLHAKHSYCVKKYNKETDTIIISNPHDTGYSIEIPLSIISKYIYQCEVNSFDLS